MNVTLDVTTVGCRIGHALSLPTHKVLTSTAELSSIYLTILAYSEQFKPGRQQIASQTVSKYHLPKDEMEIRMDPNHPMSPTAALFLWFACFCDRKRALAGNRLLNHLPSLKRASGNLCWLAGQRRNDRFSLNRFCFKRHSLPLTSCWYLIKCAQKCSQRCL